MSLKWPDKNPDLKEDFSVDWSRALKSGETISSVKWYITGDGASVYVQSATPILTLVPEYPTGLTNTDTVATIRLGGGKINFKYKVACEITTSEGRELSRPIFLRVTEGA